MEGAFIFGGFLCLLGAGYLGYMFGFTDGRLDVISRIPQRMYDLIREEDE